MRTARQMELAIYHKTESVLYKDSNHFASGPRKKISNRYLTMIIYFIEDLYGEYRNGQR